MKESSEFTESSTAATTENEPVIEAGMNSGNESTSLNNDEESEDLAPLADDHHSDFQRFEGDSDDIEDSDSEDENAHLKSISRFKQQPSNGSIRRTDSLERFLTRSERLSILGKDKPPSKDEVDKRKVKFRPDEELESVHDLEQYDDEHSWKSQCFMTDADFDRNDADMKLTHFRWQNHLNGKIRFDESESTLRGLEFMNRREQLQKDKKKAQHKNRVLEEALQQKLQSKAQYHWDILRQVSQEISAQSLSEARNRARRDRVAYCKAWGETVSDGYESDDESENLESTFGINQAQNNKLVGKHEHNRRKKKSGDKKKADDKKKKNPLLFWKK